MARYCFYCGRALAPGERCTCRTAGRSGYRPEFHQQNSDKPADSSGNPAGAAKAEAGASAARAGGAGAGAAGTSGAAAGAGNPEASKARSEKKPGEKASFRSRFAAWAAEQENQKTERRAKRRAAASARPKAQFNPRNILFFFRDLFTSPTAIIEQSRHAGLLRLVVSYLIEALVFSLIILTFVRFSTLPRIAMLRTQSLSHETLWRMAGLAMVRGFFAALVLSFLRVLIARLVFRFVGRQRIAIDDLYRAFLPGTYYEIFILLVSIFFVSGSGLQSLVMLICAFGVRAMIDGLSLKNTVQLSTDRLLFQTAMINFLLFIALAFILNFTVPSLTNVSVAPANKNKFVPNLYYSEVIEV